jgi:multiple sugar transport system ATP-binding protein
MLAAIEREKVTKVFPNETVAVDELDLPNFDGELMLVGPSRCGNAIVPRLIAGLETLSDGANRIGDKDVDDLSPRESDAATASQNSALYPQLTVGENIGFPMELRKVPKAQARGKAEAAAEVLGLIRLARSQTLQALGGAAPAGRQGKADRP